jgi:hypothetical protein
MKQKHWGFGIALLTMVFFAASCDTLTGGGSENENGNGSVDFSHHQTDYSIKVRNNTGERLVAFKGDLDNAFLIGGIPAHAPNHGLPLNTTLFNDTEDFPMILLTEAQYKAHKNSLQTQKNSPFTRVYVFYNKNGDNSAHYEIAEGLGGDNKLIVIVPKENINVELRIGGVAGETIGYAPKGMLSTNLMLENGDYDIFPVFVRYNKTRDVVERVYPKNSAGTYNWFYPITFDGSNSPQTLPLGDLLKNLRMSSGAAWVVVDNQTTSGAIRFYEGNKPRITPSGFQGISNGTPITFQIDMNAIPGTNDEMIYADSRAVSNWTFGPQGFTVALQKTKTDTTPLGTFNVEKDKMYTITVEGSFLEGGGLNAYISDTTDIPTMGDFKVE